MPPLVVDAHHHIWRQADLAKAAGVDTTLEVHERMIHAWHWFLPMLDEAQTAVDTIGRFVRRHA